MKKQDITMFSDNELSMQVFNTEKLYNKRHDKGFLELIERMYEFRPIQIHILEQNLEDDEVMPVKRNSSTNRETLAQAGSKFVNFVPGDMALVVDSDGKFELYAMNHHVSGYALLIDGVGYEFLRSVSGAELFSLIKGGI